MRSLRVELEREFRRQGVKEVWCSGFIDLDATHNMVAEIGTVFDSDEQSFDPTYVYDELCNLDEELVVAVCVNNKLTSAMLRYIIPEARNLIWTREGGWINA